MHFKHLHSLHIVRTIIGVTVDIVSAHSKDSLLMYSLEVQNATFCILIRTHLLWRDAIFMTCCLETDIYSSRFAFSISARHDFYSVFVELDYHRT